MRDILVEVFHSGIRFLATFLMFFYVLFLQQTFLFTVWSVISSGMYVSEINYVKRFSVGKQLVATYVPTYTVTNLNLQLLVLYLVLFEAH